MQINPGLSITRLGSKHLQIGSGYRALELTGITEPIRTYLGHLHDGIPDGQEHKIAEQCQVSKADFDLMMTKLAPVLVSTPFETSFVTTTDQEHRGSLARLSCVTPLFDYDRLRGLAPHSHNQFQTQRHAAALQIFGLGRTGTALTKILLESGVGHINVWDSTRVTATDLGTGLREQDIGQVRSLAVARALNPVDKRPQIHPTGWLRQPALANLATVHISLGGVHTETIIEAKEHHQPYLPVVIRDDEIDIGPWTVQQAQACPLCLEAAIAETDGFRKQRTVALRASTGGIETVAAAHLAAGLIATELLAMVDSQKLRQQVPKTEHGGVPGMNLNTYTRVHLAEGWVQTFTLQPRPGCCAAVQELKIANTSVP
ncbi:MAG TPA: ThiF family adenylyltransferase [Candidatus Yaniella excrementigallinarum]|nr:ThiF family adenylyltransferase [Candidatus Yaniella excrementigallinarum]